MSNLIPAWNPAHGPAVIVFAMATVAYLLNHYVPQAFPRLLRRPGASEHRVRVQSTMLARVFGGAVLGLLPWVSTWYLPASDVQFGFNLRAASLSIAIAAGACVLVLLGWWIVARTWPAGFVGYPEADVRRWNRSLVVANTLSWFVYLLGYEYFFRGVILFALASALGPWIAIAASTALYAYSHLPKAAQEASTTPFLGVFFAVTTLGTGSILCAWLVHSVYAASAELFAVGADPERHFEREWGSPW